MLLSTSIRHGGTFLEMTRELYVQLYFVGSLRKVKFSVVCVSVCLSVCSQGGGLYKTLPQDKWGLGWTSLNMCMAGGGRTGVRILYRAPPPPDVVKLIHYEAQTVGKRVVGIRLNLVYWCIEARVFSSSQLVLKKTTTRQKQYITPKNRPMWRRKYFCFVRGSFIKDF